MVCPSVSPLLPPLGTKKNTISWLGYCSSTLIGILYCVVSTFCLTLPLITRAQDILSPAAFVIATPHELSYPAFPAIILYETMTGAAGLFMILYDNLFGKYVAGLSVCCALTNEYLWSGEGPGVTSVRVPILSVALQSLPSPSLKHKNSPPSFTVEE